MNACRNSLVLRPLTGYLVKSPRPHKKSPGKCANVGISIQRRVSGIRFVTPESSFCSAPTGFPQLGWCYMDCHFMECLVQSLRFCVCCVLLLLVGIGVLRGCIVQFLRFCVCGVSLDWLEACVFDGMSCAISCFWCLCCLVWLAWGCHFDGMPRSLPCFLCLWCVVGMTWGCKISVVVIPLGLISDVLEGNVLMTACRNSLVLIPFGSHFSCP